MYTEDAFVRAGGDADARAGGDAVARAGGDVDVLRAVGDVRVTDALGDVCRDAVVSCTIRLVCFAGGDGVAMCDVMASPRV